MKLFYTVGGGLGHLTRFTSFLNTMKIDEAVTIIASSPFARDSRVIDPRHQVLIPPFKAARTREDLIVWLQKVVDELKPEQVYIDAFPAGILGELTEVFFPAETEIYLLARIIKWPVYAERIPVFNSRFTKVFRFECLDEDYEKFLSEHADEIVDIDLKRETSEDQVAGIPEGCWLVIHSGPDSELESLLRVVKEHLERAKSDPQVVVVYPGHRPEFVPETFSFITAYPVFSTYGRAERVYSGAGFNMVDQMRKFRAHHYVMPFERILDDQFARCRLYQQEFAEVLK